MPRFAALLPNEVDMKGAGEPVTVADREAEAMIGAELLALIPYSRVIGEEACSASPALLDNLGDGVVWIVDPIDGTANFAAGRSPFAMMTALMRNGELVGSWIYNPQRDHLAVAELGGGAWIGGDRVRASPSPRDPGEWHGIISRAFLPKTKEILVDTVSGVVARVDPTKRCAGYEYPLVATGQRDFALYWRTLVWDHAPGALLISEAGGSVSHLDGARYDPLISRSGLLVAHDGHVSETLLKLTHL